MRSAAVPVEPRHGGQRRANRRYPIAADVAYQLVQRGRTVAEGRGRMVNMSSCGILIATETSLPVGLAIILQIAWPAMLDHFVALNLHVRGCTVRSSGKHTALIIGHYEFHTRGQVQLDVEAGAALQAHA